MQKNKALYPNTFVEHHFKQFTSLQKKNGSIGDIREEPNDALSHFTGHGKVIPNKCDQLAFSHLQSYFSSPISFSVPLLKMANILKEEIPLSSDSEKCDKQISLKDSVALESKIPLLAVNKLKNDSSSGNKVLNENKKQPAKKRTFKKGGRASTRKGKRKPAHQAALSLSSTSENQVSNKSRNVIGGEQQQQQAVTSSKTTVKLASAPYTHGRKRGAEVLTAEFVNDDKVNKTKPVVTSKRKREPSTVLKNKLGTGKARKMSSAEDASIVRKRSPRRKASAPDNRNKVPDLQTKSETGRKAIAKRQEQSGKQYGKTVKSINTVPYEPSSKSSMGLSLTVEQSSQPAPIPENIMERRISMYESHALNLLADLALNSFSSSSMSYMNSANIDCVCEPEKVTNINGTNAIECTQVDSCSPLQSSPASIETVQALDCVTNQPKVGSDVSHTISTSPVRAENSEKQASQKVLIAAAKAKARNNTTSKISLEHSYSQLPRDSSLDKSPKGLNEKPLESVCELKAASPNSEVLVEQSSDLSPQGELLFVANDKRSPSQNTEAREVSKNQENFAITFKWEANYDFEFDSRFTHDPLEKTINRALHGPWNHHLKEKVEDVKIILHMWLALFYSKSSQLLTSTSRNVVEHSNPAKYVSINTVHDPLQENPEIDAVDSNSDNESGPLKDYTRPQILSEEMWPEEKENHSNNQAMDLSVARVQTKMNHEESEHRYSKRFSNMQDIQRSSDSEDCMLLEPENGESSQISEVTVLPEPKSHTQADALSPLGIETHQASTSSEPIPQECSHVSSTNDVTDVSPSDALNTNKTTDVFNKDDSDNSEAKKQDFLKKRRNLLSLMDSMQNKHADSKQREATLLSADSRSVLEAKLQEINVDTAVGQSNEKKDLGTSNVPIVNARINEENSYYINDLKSSCLGPTQTNATLGEDKDASNLRGFKYGYRATPIKEKEVSKKWTVGSGYSQENEHSYVSKAAAFSNMCRLELSFSSSDTSDVEDTYAAIASLAESTEDEGESHSVETPDMLNNVAESNVAALHKNDSPEDDGSQANRNSVAIVKDHLSEVNVSEMKEKSLKVHSQSPNSPRDSVADEIDSLSTISADNQAKASEATDSSVLQSDEVENDMRDHLSDNTQTSKEKSFLLGCESKNVSVFESQGKPSSLFGSESKKVADLKDQGEQSSLLSSKSSEIIDLESLGEQSSLLSSKSSEVIDLENLEQPSLLGSKSSEVIDLESLGEQPSLLGSKSSEVIDLERSGEKSSLPGSESSEVIDLESLGEQSSLLGLESSKTADCNPMFQKLKAVGEMHTSSTLAKIQDFEMNDINNHTTENKSLDSNQSVELVNKQSDPCNSHVMDTEVPNTIEAGVALGPEAINKGVTLAGKSKSNKTVQDSDGATNKPMDKCVDGNADLISVDSLGGSTADNVSVELSSQKPDKRTTDLTEGMKNTIRRAILSKLKRICQGSSIPQHVSSNSEDDVYIVHEKPGKWRGEAKKQADNKIVDIAKSEINTVSSAEIACKTPENQTPQSEILEENMLQKEAVNDPPTSAEPVILQEAEQVVTQTSMSPLHEDSTDHMDQDPGPDQSDTCCILNTSTISKEQHDRLPETSDDDIEFVQAYKEPLTHKSQNIQPKCHKGSSTPLEELSSHPKLSHSRKTKHLHSHSGPSTSPWDADTYVSKYPRDTAYPSSRSRRSLIAKLKDVGRPTVHNESFYSGRSNPNRLFYNRRMVSHDLTQSTLDLEHLRFMCRLKDVLRKSSLNVEVSEPPFQTMFDSRRIPSYSSSTTKSVSPILVTVQCRHRRRDYSEHDSWFPSSSYSTAYYEEDIRDKSAFYSRPSKKSRKRRPNPAYHFQRLRYESTLEQQDSDISLIIKECTKSNHLKLSHVGVGGTSACPVPEERDLQIRRTLDSTPTKLQTRLHTTARESAQSNCYFYINKAIDNQDDDEFFSSTKSQLIKDGYTSIEPQDFCNNEQPGTDKLLVVIQNENVSSQIHKIPCLLQLRLLPNVTFAGVDTPEDLSESMYQELFQTGGFVVSDKALLENITIEKLKEVLALMEKMSRMSSWKWLIHYGEFRKLKEDKRAESVSQIKIPLLKTYQQSNVVEILPYHACDSRSKDLADDFQCLLSLQRQHIRSRLAVYLTVTQSTDTEEFGQNGFLVYDVDSFIRRIEKVDAKLQPDLGCDLSRD